MSLEKSVQRRKNSQIVPDQFGFHLSDIYGLFDAYNAMSEADQQGGMFTLVMGRDKKGLEDVHLVLRNAAGEVQYNGNESHPCPPWEDEHCSGG